MNAGDLAICGRCHQLKGPVPAGPVQLCGCATEQQRADQPLWGGDFNMYAELCRCCGLELLKSGSKWGVWFCEPCKTNVRSLNNSAGRCLVPIGRHSLMNGVGLPASDAHRKSGVAGFAAALAGFCDAIDWIEWWAAEVVGHNLAELGLPVDTDVPLDRYLEVAQRSSLTRIAALDRLTQALSGPSGRR